MKDDVFKGAEWIWLDTEIYPEYQESAYTFFCERKPYCVAHFVKKVRLNCPVSAQTVVCADCKYILFLNGEIVARGPAAVGGDYGNTAPLGYRFYDRPQLIFRNGENIVEALVLLQPTQESDYSDGQGGFLFASDIVCAGKDKVRVVSDESWLAFRDDRFLSDYHADLTCISEPHFAKVIRRGYMPEEKFIPELHSEYIFPVGERCFTANGQREAHIDFGKVYTGYLHLHGKAEKETQLEVEFFERENWPITFRDSGKEFLKVPKGEFSFVHLHLRSARYAVVRASAPVRLSAEWEYVTYPVQYRGSFRCSDPLINQIYDVCVRTACNCMNTYHMDSPVHQEAIGCTGDYFIQSLIGYYAFGDAALTRLDLVRDARYFRLKSGHRLHTSYGMIWPQWLDDYIRYTDDESVFAEVEDALEILMARYEGYLDERGIVSRSHNFWFIDWSLPNGYGPLDDGKSVWQAALTAFTYRGFSVAARLMRRFGKVELAAHYGDVAERIKDGFRLFWDKERGLYFGGMDADRSREKYFGIHENVLAVLYGLYEGDEQAFMRKVMENKTLTPAQPYFMHFVFEALLKTGLFERYGLIQIKRWKNLLEECNSSLKEAWDSLPGCDYSHAWSGTPGYILPRAVLGAAPAEDGWESGSFLPDLCGLEWAEGVIPTPDGDFLYASIKTENISGKFEEKKDEKENNCA